MVGVAVIWMRILGPSPTLTRVYMAFGLPAAFFVLMFPWVLVITAGAWARRNIQLSQGRLSGKRFATLAIVLGTAVVVLPICLFLCAPGHPASGMIRAKVRRVKSDMRSLGSAIDAYFSEHNRYPAWGIGDRGPGGTATYNYLVWREWARSPDPRTSSPSFLMNGSAPNQNFATLTTPVAFAATYAGDPFASVRGSTYVYWCVFPGEPEPSGRIIGKDSPVNGTGWILVSCGPDLDFDIEGEWDVYDPSESQPSKRLLAGTNRKGHAFTYDPTNGAISHGDIWRVKQ